MNPLNEKAPTVHRDHKAALIAAPSSALARTGSQELARRGLRDLDAAQHGKTGSGLPGKSGDAPDNSYHIATGRCCPEDQARLLFCLDHQCTHDLCPAVPHLDFALIPVENVRPEVLQRSIQEGQAAGEYYVVHDGTGWHVLEDGEVGWDSESLPDGTVLLKTPEQLRGQLRGPFSKREAQNFVEEKKWRDHDQIVRLPRIVPHLWVSPDSDDAADGFAVGCSYCGESDPAQERNPCPKRSSYTWYEVLGVPEGADENQIVSAYRELVNAWDPKRLQSRDDIFLDCGYSETQIKWFNAAYAVLSDPVERRQYDAELLRHGGPERQSAQATSKPKPKMEDLDSKTGQPKYKSYEEYEEAKDAWFIQEALSQFQARHQPAKLTPKPKIDDIDPKSNRPKYSSYQEYVDAKDSWLCQEALRQFRAGQQQRGLTPRPRIDAIDPTTNRFKYASYQEYDDAKDLWRLQEAFRQFEAREPQAKSNNP